MNDLLRESLCKIIEQDPSLHSDAGRCRGTLSDDLRGKYPKEIQLIVAAINYGVPAKLLALKGKALTQVQLDSFKQELQDKEYLEKTVAQWIVESWALALGVISSAQCRTFQKSSSPSAGSNSLKGVSSPQLGTATSATSTSSPSNPTAGTQNSMSRKKLSLLVILGVGGILTLLVAGIYAVLQIGRSDREPKVLTSSSPPTVKTSLTPSPAPTPSLSPSLTPTPTLSPSLTPTPTLSPSLTPTPTPTSPVPPISPIKLASPPPSINEINNAISKLKAMNPNEILEFPVEEDPNYIVSGFKIGSDKYFGWNVKTVKDFLQESLQHNGKFSESDQITLIVLNQSTKQREIKSLSTNSPLGYFVSFVNSNRVIVKPPQPPTINEINNAISKLKAKNPNEILGFPVEEDPNYIVISFKRGTDEEKPWNVKTIEDFLQESLQYNGKFPESDQITLTVLNQSTQKITLKPFSKNSCLGHFVRSLNSS